MLTASPQLASNAFFATELGLKGHCQKKPVEDTTIAVIENRGGGKLPQIPQINTCIYVVVNASLFGHMRRFGMRWLIYPWLWNQCLGMLLPIEHMHTNAVNTISVASGRNVMMTFPNILINCEGKSIQEVE